MVDALSLCYCLKLAVDCEWNDWIVGECSKTCGDGTRTKDRTKNVTESNGGTCPGEFFEIEACKTQECPIDCEWNDWTLGECSQTCGNGTRTDTRTKAIVEANGGNCTGESTKIEKCNLQQCPGRLLTRLIFV